MTYIAHIKVCCNGGVYTVYKVLRVTNSSAMFIIGDLVVFGTCVVYVLLCV